MDKYQKLKQETNNRQAQEMIDAFKPLEKLQNMIGNLRESKLPFTIVTIYQEDYAVEYSNYDGEIEIQSIDGHSDIEDTFKDSFVTKVIDRIGEEIRAGKEYKGEMKSDESRGN